VCIDDEPVMKSSPSRGLGKSLKNSLNTPAIACGDSCLVKSILSERL
jgi:hypothetical protein